MLRKLVATGIVFAAGYVVGVIFGFRAAVVDYVENDAESIEKMAEDLYPSPEEGQADGESVPSVVEDALREANEKQQERNSADGRTKGFQ